MNKDQVSGKVDQVTGKVKEKVGEAVGNQGLANQGVADQVKGAAKETWGNVKDAAHETAEHHKHESEQSRFDARKKVVNTVQNIKDKVNEKIDEAQGRTSGSGSVVRPEQFPSTMLQGRNKSPRTCRGLFHLQNAWLLTGAAVNPLRQTERRRRKSRHSW